MDDLAHLVDLCSPWSWLLIAGQTVLVAVLLERAVVLCFHLRVDAEALCAVLTKLVRGGQLERARKLAGTLPPAWAQVLVPALDAMTGDPGCVRDTCERRLGDAEALVWKRFGRLGVAALFMLGVGLLGSGRFLIRTLPIDEVEGPLGLPLAWVPVAWGAAAALSTAVLGGLLALRAARIQRDLRALPKFLERLASEAAGR